MNPSSPPLASLFFVCTLASVILVSPSCVPQSNRPLETKTGLASFYGRAFQGEETASGEPFNMNELVAAHPSYPLGTRVRVKNLENNREVEVRVIDRGPTKENQVEGVIIDLSQGAARALEMVRDGRVNVQVEVLEWGDDKRVGQRRQ